MRHVTRSVWMLLLMLMAAEAFLVDDNHDETLQAALTAIEELNSRLQEVTSRLHAAEKALAANTIKLSTDRNDLTSLKSRAVSGSEPTTGDLLLPSEGQQPQDNDFIWYGDWVLAFRATRGIGKPVYDTWTAVGHHDDDPVTRISLPCGCTSVDGSLPCDRHYRSRLLDTWPSSSIDQVRLVVYSHGVEKAHVTFRGTDSTYMSWFSLDRVVDSSWEDLTAKATVNYFSIQGDVHSNLRRRFFISHAYGDCPKDFGWFVVNDQMTAGCTWEKKNYFPSFMYSPSGHLILDNDLAEGDVMAVFVKFRQSANLGDVCMR
ncbi:uncharacterized protein LOC112566859 isoform X1 [Pomacea canaliculata]|uniref:uncharacterized protein LOC112566859 isoform X1 n=1 Tax=Pomacea canaliculata TaxID=400727 RepID=UPI000D72A9EB|nr:uncharacterized protein LOC112566859 isoform X1 [Pomacea canaliculata]